MQNLIEHLKPYAKLSILAPVLLIIAILIRSMFMDKFGKIGSDNDDVMRLVQIKDFLAGQNWFDMHQYRLGPEPGTLIHWSRIVDAPILALNTFFRLFLSPDLALSTAYSVWPPLCAGLALLGLIYGARQLGGTYIVFFTTLLSAIALFSNYRFQSGAIDHHNLQLTMMSLALAGAISPLRKPLSLALSGSALAISIATGAEVYTFAALICAFIALDWAITGQSVRAGTMAFGASFALMAGALFLATIDPQTYLTVYCDSFSWITLAGSLVGGLGLCSAAAFLSGSARPIRIMALIGLGLACAILLKTQAPECLRNPYDALSPLVKSEWLNNLMESVSVFKITKKSVFEMPYMLGPIFVASLVCLWRIKINSDRRAYGQMGLLLILSVGLAAYQIRFIHFGQIFALLPLGAWVGHLYAKRIEKQTRSLSYLFAIALTLPIIWAGPGLLLRKPEPKSKTLATQSFLTPKMLSHLNTLPVGLVLTSSNNAPDLLNKTKQRALHGNYHRNPKGIEAALKIFTSAPEQALELMRLHKITYILVCPGDAETGNISAKYSKGFLAQLAKGETFPFLTLLNNTSSKARLFRVNLEAATVSGSGQSQENAPNQL